MVERLNNISPLRLSLQEFTFLFFGSLLSNEPLTMTILLVFVGSICSGRRSQNRALQPNSRDWDNDTRELYS